MRAVLAAAGSRGDVVPFVACARRLAADGHEVTLLTHASLLAPPTGPGLGGAGPARIRTIGVPSDPAGLLAGPAGSALRRGSPRALNRTRHLFADFLHSFADPARGCLGDADVLIASTFAVAAVEEAVRARVPVVRVHLWPEYPSVDGPMPLLPYGWRLPPPVRRSARSALRSVERYLGGFDGWWEGGRLQLVAHHPVGLTTATLGTVHAYSPHVVPPLAATGHDVCVSGWWVGESDPLSAATTALLAEEGPWVYVGFGSMHQARPDRLVADVAAACRALGVRGVVQVPEPAGGLPQELVAIGTEPHEALFGRMAAVVHHGGSGTTGTAVRAGVPSVVVPHFADQYYWGHRLHALGVAPRPLPRSRLTAARLTDRLAAALDPARVERARLLGDQVRAEDGTGVAVRHVDRLLARAARG